MHLFVYIMNRRGVGVGILSRITHIHLMVMVTHFRLMKLLLSRKLV
jgi:hypothetical protein